MVKPGVLLLLLAGAANFHLSMSLTIDISSCPINFFEESYSSLEANILPGSQAELCFNGGGDCISVGNVGNADMVQGTTTFRTEELSIINEVPTCHNVVEFSVTGGAWTVRVLLYSADRAAAVKVVSRTFLVEDNELIEVSITSNDNIVETHYIFPTDLLQGRSMDLTGCRQSGTGYGPGDTYVASTCTTVKCDRMSGVATETTCTDPEKCINGQCSLSMCTVTGSSVIDFHNTKVAIPDRCAYTLVKPASGSAFELVAVFKERRRKDVPLLDHLIFTISGSKIYLEQGGRVLDGDDIVMLSETAEERHGVALSKVNDKVILAAASQSITVSFDGNTAHVSGPMSNSFQGLCGNPSYDSYTPSLDDLRSTEFDAKCSESKTDDALDPDCITITPHCELMMQAPFDACSELIDPEPYIAACKDILCHYPDSDGHKCQFFEAYAVACEVSVHTLVDWSSVAGCSAKPHACHDKYCADDEFCGNKVDGTSRCFCRALFAEKYPDSFGQTTTCTSNAATLILANCLLEDKDIDHTTLHLNDPNCDGDFDDTTHMVTFHFDDGDNVCGTKVAKDGENVEYSNIITTQDFSSDVIVRHDQVTIDFSCHYKPMVVKDVTFKIVEGSVKKTYTSGEWTYTLEMNAYTDQEHHNMITADTDLQLNQKVYVTLVATGLDSNSNVVIVTQSCFAKSDQATENDPQHNLITNRCQDDDTVTVEGNGEGTSNSFSFNMFQFTHKNGKINLHCEVGLCVPATENCLPDCDDYTARKRRSFRSKYDRNSAFITMSWDN